MVATLNNWDFSIRVDENRPIPGQRTSPADIKSLLDKLTYLPPRDRRVLELRARAGFTLKDIADLTGHSRSAISRRLSALRHRLRDPIVRALLRHATEFDRQELEIALLHFAAGQGVERIAHDRRVTERHVIAVLATVRGWHRNLWTQGGASRRGDSTPADPSDARHTAQRRG